MRIGEQVEPVAHLAQGNGADDPFEPLQRDAPLAVDTRRRCDDMGCAATRADRALSDEDVLDGERVLQDGSSDDHQQRQ